MRSRRPIDLLVVDEAHKLESDQRTIFMSEVLAGRVSRALFVTATPFALNVEQLMDRLGDLYDATAWPGKERRIETVKIDVETFVGNVGKDADAASGSRGRVEESLGRYLVRSRWPDRFGKHGADRRSHQPIPPRKVNRAITETDALAILALETAYRRIANCGERVHRASYRETLCSSYAAVRKTLKRKDIEERTPLPRFLQGLANFIPRNGESLKFQTAKDFLVQCANERHKVVVFCKRTATVELMRREIHAAMERERIASAKAWRGVQKNLHSWWKERCMEGMTKSDCFAWLRFAVHRDHTIRVTKKNWKSVARMMHKHGLRAAEGRNYSERLQHTWGAGQRVDWVAELSGSTPDKLSSRLSVEEQKQRGRTKDEVRFAFNLPGPPYVLVCTSVAREGIDLHHWCHKVLQYDLEWNPAWMEQQVGRVDRINSLAQRRRIPVDVYYAHLPGTYEERIADEVKRRCDMLRLVLGAGQWLADKPEDQKRIRDLDRYKLDFQPRG
jgi:ERCC4-related helicase